jgi:hypothetical protein
MTKAHRIVNTLLEDCGECEGDLDVERYMAMVKAHPQLRRLSREELRRYLATRPPVQPEPHSEPHQIIRETDHEGEERRKNARINQWAKKNKVKCTCGAQKYGNDANHSSVCAVFKKIYKSGRVLESIEQDLVAASKRIRHCGDYGSLWYHPGKHEVHWTAGDADGPPEYTDTDDIQKLLSLPGIKHVEIGDEWSPDEDEGWKRLDESEELPLDPEDTRSEVDRLLPTKTYTLQGSSLVHAPGLINVAQNEWRNGRKKQKTWAMNLVKAWVGLPEEVYLAILDGNVQIETQGDNAIVTVKQY